VEDPATPTEAQRKELDRIGAFSDGVFAIAITILVLGIDLPSRGEDLSDALTNLDSDLQAYFIGFAVIGSFWYGHHKLFALIRRSDGALLLANFALLSLICLMPFSTALLGNFNQPLSTVIFAVNVGAAALADGLTGVIAVRRGLVEEGALGDERTLLIGTVLRSAVFVLSIPIAYANVAVAELSWLLLIIVPRVSRAISPAS
jgi:uncharacterized membrane protein